MVFFGIYCVFFVVGGDFCFISVFYDSGVIRVVDGDYMVIFGGYCLLKKWGSLI